MVRLKDMHVWHVLQKMGYQYTPYVDSGMK